MDRDDPIFRLSDRPNLRLGVMGGAFDPIHIAHLVTAEEALQQFQLDEVVFMPVGTPPHKSRGLAPAEFRYMLVSVATAGHPHFWVSRYEIDREEVGFTVDALEFLARTLRPDAQLFFITGADAVLEILGWKDPIRVLELCTLIAATRPGYDLSRLAGATKYPGADFVEPGSNGKIWTMEVPALAISSSMIRERLAAGKAARFLVPDSVAQLIEKTQAYGQRGDQGREA